MRPPGGVANHKLANIRAPRDPQTNHFEMQNRYEKETPDFREPEDCISLFSACICHAGRPRSIRDHAQRSRSIPQHMRRSRSIRHHARLSRSICHQANTSCRLNIAPPHVLVWLQESLNLKSMLTDFQHLLERLLNRKLQVQNQRANWRVNTKALLKGGLGDEFQCEFEGKLNCR